MSACRHGVVRPQCQMRTNVQLVDLDKQRQGLREAKRAAQHSAGIGSPQLTQQWVTLPGHVDVRFSTETALKWLDSGVHSHTTLHHVELATLLSSRMKSSILKFESPVVQN